VIAVAKYQVAKRTKYYNTNIS